MTRYRPREYEIEDGPWDPISGGASALLGTIGSLMMGAVDFPVEILKALKVKPSEKVNPENDSKDHNAATTSNICLNSLDSSGMGSSKRVFPEEGAQSSPRSSTSDKAAGQSQPGSETHSHSNEQLESPRTSSDISIEMAQTGARKFGVDTEARSPRGSMSGLCLKRSSSKGPRESPSRSSTNRSSTPGDTFQHHQRTASANQAGQISLDAALGAGKGIGRMVEAGLKSPMDFTLSIARGFHNAPKLYGDESVRPSDKITGIQSGLRAAGKV